MHTAGGDGLRTARKFHKHPLGRSGCRHPHLRMRRRAPERNAGGLRDTWNPRQRTGVGATRAGLNPATECMGARWPTRTDTKATPAEASTGLWHLKAAGPPELFIRRPRNCAVPNMQPCPDQDERLARSCVTWRRDFPQASILLSLWPNAKSTGGCSVSKRVLAADGCRRSRQTSGPNFLPIHNNRLDFSSSSYGTSVRRELLVLTSPGRFCYIPPTL